MRARYAGAVLVAVLLAGGCARGNAVRQLRVTTKDYAFEGLPSTIKGGRIDLTLRNRGTVTHEMGAIALASGGIAKFRKGFGPVVGDEGAPFPSWMKTGASPAFLEPGKTFRTSYVLKPGRYMFFCAETGVAGSKKDGKPHFERGMYQIVDVEGDNGERPTAPGGVFTAKDYTFVAPKGLHAGRQTFVFHNTSRKQWHFMGLSVFPKGVTPAEAEDAFGKLLSAGEGPPPKGVPTPKDVRGAGVFSPGLSGTFSTTFLPGRTYLAVCFIQDRTGGPPHAIAHHMYKAFTVPE